MTTNLRDYHKMMNRLFVMLLLVIFPGAVCVHGQAVSSNAPTFDVISIKLADPGSRMTRFEIDRGTVNCRNVPFKLFLQMVYDIKAADQMTGLPAGIGAQKFDIQAKVDEATLAAFAKMSPEESSAKMDVMVQGMLEDRFHMKISRQTKELSVFALVVAKGGPKIVPSVDDASTAGGTMGNSGSAPASIVSAAGGGGIGAPRPSGRHFSARGSPVSTLVGNLTRQPETGGRVVIDKTGLTGKYDWDMRWTPESATGDPGPDAPPSFFTAIQEQLGLKLEPQKGPVEVLVIDHIEMPSAN